MAMAMAMAMAADKKGQTNRACTVPPQAGETAALVAMEEHEELDVHARPSSPSSFSALTHGNVALLEASDLLDPNPDICGLFCYFNHLYFGGQLHACTVAWSSSRMTLCAGICTYSQGSCSIRLSEPLLKFRSTRELKETLLHEMIHAYLWLTKNNKDHDDHGSCFQEMMHAINNSKIDDLQRPPEGYNISIFHNFSDEVNNYRRHQWRCAQCGDLIKRASNRTPSQSDCYKKIKQGRCDISRCHWHIHQQQCGGEYEKIAEPEGYKDKRRKIQTSGMEVSAGNKSSLQVTKKNPTVVSNGSEKNPNKGKEATSLLYKDCQLERFFSCNKEIIKKEGMIVKGKEDSDDSACFLSEEEIVATRTKRGGCEIHDGMDDALSRGVEANRNVTLKTHHNKMCADPDDDIDHVECTGFIGWKCWYAFEGEEEEKDVEFLTNKRSVRRQLEKRCRLLQYNKNDVELVGQNIAIHDNRSTMGSLEVTSIESNFLDCDETSVVSHGETMACGSQDCGYRTGFNYKLDFIDNKGIAEVKRQKTSEKEINIQDTPGNHVSGRESDDFCIGKILEKTIKLIKKRRTPRKSRHVIAAEGSTAVCPICQVSLSGNIEDREFNVKLNEHIDACMKNLS